MLQANDLGRLLSIYISQIILSMIFLYIAYKILKRHRNRLTKILSTFYILEAIAFILNAILVPIRANPLVSILYFCMIFLVLFGQIFLVMFNLFLYRIELNIPTKNLAIYLLIYAILIFSILYFPNGITINQKTNWRPIWTWTFLIIILLFFSSIILIPFIILFIKLYMHFKDKNLKKKMMVFFLGFCGVTISLYGGMLYVTWQNPIFREIWSIVLFFIIIPSCLLIYYGIGTEI